MKNVCMKMQTTYLLGASSKPLGAWWAQVAEHPTLVFGPGHDLGFWLEPVMESVLSGGSARGSSLPPLTHTLSLSQINKTNL